MKKMLELIVVNVIMRSLLHVAKGVIKLSWRDLSVLWDPNGILNAFVARYSLSYCNHGYCCYWLLLLLVRYAVLHFKEAITMTLRVNHIAKFITMPRGVHCVLNARNLSLVSGLEYVVYCSRLGAHDIII